MSAHPTIAGVMVTFHPDPDFERRLSVIAKEVSFLIVVDNTAEVATQDRLRVACAVHQAHLIANGENLGLAVALNHAFTLIAERGVAWAIAFDQDSTPEPGFAAALFAVAASEPRCAVVGANWFDEARLGFASRHLRRHRVFPWLFERTPADGDLKDVTCVITSGTLFRLDAWRTLGGFDESLFLDLVDTDYCLRAQAAGFAVSVAVNARLAHRRGAKHAVTLFGHTWWPAFMPPQRLRYLFRNRVPLFIRHGWRRPHWVAFELVYTGKILVEILLLEDHKFTKLAACIRGTWDGLLGSNGRIPSPSA